MDNILTAALKSAESTLQAAKDAQVEHVGDCLSLHDQQDILKQSAIQLIDRITSPSAPMNFKELLTEWHQAFAALMKINEDLQGQKEYMEKGAKIVLEAKCAVDILREGLPTEKVAKIEVETSEYDSMSDG